MPRGGGCATSGAGGGFRSSIRRGVVGRTKDRVREPSPKRLVVAELPEEFGVVLQYPIHDATQGLVVLDAGVLLVVVLLGVPVRLVGGNLRGDFFCDEAFDAVLVCPFDVPEL